MQITLVNVQHFYQQCLPCSPFCMIMSEIASNIVVDNGCQIKLTLSCAWDVKKFHLWESLETYPRLRPVERNSQNTSWSQRNFHLKFVAHCLPFKKKCREGKYIHILKSIQYTNSTWNYVDGKSVRSDEENLDADSGPENFL